MALEPLIIRYQEGPIIAATCPELNLRFEEIRDVQNLSERTIQEVIKAINHENQYFTENQNRIYKELQRYQRIKKLYKKLGTIQDFLDYQLLPPGTIADRFGFKE